MTPARVSPDRFAAALAARLHAVVPSGISVRAEGSAVSVYDPLLAGGSASAELLMEEDGRSVVELVELAAYGILDAIQDVVMESTKEQWPDPSGARNAPGAEARVVGQQLQMWFGDEAAPAIRLAPIDLSELVNGAA